MLKGHTSEHPTLCAQLNTQTNTSIASSLQQLSSSHPHYQTIVNPFDAMLPVPCGRFLFLKVFVQCLTLANQLNHICKAETEIDTTFICIWANIYSIVGTKMTTAPAIQIKCHSSYKAAIQALLLTLVSPLQLMPKTPGISFRGKWCSSLMICSL